MTTVATESSPRGDNDKQTVKYLGSVAIGSSNASLDRPIRQLSLLWLPMADSFTSTLQSLGAIETAGGHLVHQRLAKAASWASPVIVLSAAVGTIPIHSAKPAGSGEATTSKRGQASSSNSRAHQKKKKRGRPGDNNSQSDEDERGGPANNKSAAKRRREEAESTRRKLACPFAKKDPVRWRSCYRHELTKISYVKQHLYRVHLLPPYCRRCGHAYEHEDALANHMRDLIPCAVRSDFAVPEGLTAAQRERLSERLSPKLSDEERWYAVFDIVFPDHRPRPATPYVDPDVSEDLASFRDHVARDGARILVDAYRRAEGDAGPPSLAATMQRGLDEISSSWQALRSPTTTALGQDPAADVDDQQQQQQQPTSSSPRRSRSPAVDQQPPTSASPRRLRPRASSSQVDNLPAAD